jgi:hypothetical protein
MGWEGDDLGKLRWPRRVVGLQWNGCSCRRVRSAGEGHDGV